MTNFPGDISSSVIKPQPLLVVLKGISAGYSLRWNLRFVQVFLQGQFKGEHSIQVHLCTVNYCYKK